LTLLSIAKQPGFKPYILGCSPAVSPMWSQDHVKVSSLSVFHDFAGKAILIFSQ
jgi:hypothetical protein